MIRFKLCTSTIAKLGLDGQIRGSSAIDVMLYLTKLGSERMVDESYRLRGEEVTTTCLGTINSLGMHVSCFAVRNSVVFSASRCPSVIVLISVICLYIPVG